MVSFQSLLSRSRDKGAGGLGERREGRGVYNATKLSFHLLFEETMYISSRASTVFAQTPTTRGTNAE